MKKNKNKKNLKPSNEEAQLGVNNVKKINKLVWNPDRLEIEYKEEDHRGSTASPETNSESSQFIPNHIKSNLSPEVIRRQNSADVIIISFPKKKRKKNLSI